MAWTRRPRVARLLRDIREELATVLRQDLEDKLRRLAPPGDPRGVDEDLSVAADGADKRGR